MSTNELAHALNEQNERLSGKTPKTELRFGKSKTTDSRELIV